MSMSMISSRAVEAGLMAACLSYTGEVLNWLCEKEYLTVSAEEVLAELRKLPGPSIVSARSAAMSKVRKSKSKSSVMVKGKPEIVLPFCGVVEESWCKGIRYNHGLHSQCTNGAVNGGKYCKTCSKSAKNSASGKPTYGDINDRMEGELLEFRDPKGKQTQCYANVAAKLGLDLEAAKAEAEKFGWTIPENQLTIQTVKRGRPSKKSEEVVKSKGKVGRPSKVVKATNSMDEQIAQLVAEAAEDVVGEVSVSKKNVVRKSAEEKAAEKEAKKAAKEAEKKAKKAAKEAEKAAKKAAKEAEKKAKKAAKEAEKKAKKAAKEAARQPSKTELKKKELQKEAAECGLEIADSELNSLKIGEIRAMLKEHKTAIKSKNVEETTEEKKDNIEEVIFARMEEDELTNSMNELVLEEEPVEESSDDEEENDGPEIDPDTTPKVTIDEVTYYKVNAYGVEGLLFTMEGDMVGAHDSESNTIMEVEIE